MLVCWKNECLSHKMGITAFTLPTTQDVFKVKLTAECEKAFNLCEALQTWSPATAVYTFQPKALSCLAKKSQWLIFFFFNKAKFEAGCLICEKFSQKNKDHPSPFPPKRDNRGSTRLLARSRGRANFPRSPCPVWTVSPGPGTNRLALHPLGEILALSKWMDLEVFLRGDRYYLKLCNSWKLRYSTNSGSRRQCMT